MPGLEEENKVITTTRIFLVTLSLLKCVLKCIGSEISFLTF